MDKNIFQQMFPVAVFLLLLMPLLTSAPFDLKQKRANELIAKEQKIRQEAEEKNYLTGKFDQEQNADFILVPAEYVIDGSKMYLRKETLGAFLQMESAAKKDEMELKITSATRNFIEQKNFWNNQWSGVALVYGQNLAESIPDGPERFKKILEYTAVPGASRHHWGTDIDLNIDVDDTSPASVNSQKDGEKYNWLVQNARLYGFCQTYNPKGSARQYGYNAEKWHWSYLPLARIFTQEYKNLITDTDIKGFDGDEYVAGKDLINKYVLGINPDCL
jgi:LAS superfamily LD-carboxypeptidase LdcB